METALGEEFFPHFQGKSHKTDTAIEKKSEKSLRFLVSFFKFIAHGFITVSISCNIIFYGSLAVGFFSGLLYVAIGILLDLFKIGLVIAFNIFLEDRNKKSAIICIVSWVVLSIFSLLAAFGYMSVINTEFESRTLTQSNIYQSKLNVLETANEKVNEFSSYADVNIVETAQTKFDGLETKKTELLNSPAINSLDQRTGDTVQTQIGSCPGTSFYQKKYCPQIERFDRQKKEFQEVVNGHKQYLSAIAFRNNAQKDLAELDISNAGMSVHPVFVNLSGLALGKVGPHFIKYIFLVILSIAVELFSSLSFYICGLLLKRLKPPNFEDNLEEVSKILIERNILTSENDLKLFENFFRQQQNVEKQTVTVVDSLNVQKTTPLNIESESKIDGERIFNIFCTLRKSILERTIASASFLDIENWCRKKGLKINRKDITKLREMIVDNKLGVFDSTNKIVWTSISNADGP